MEREERGGYNLPPPEPSWLKSRGVARGYRQRAILSELIAGNTLLNPLWWRGERLVNPRWQERLSWYNFLDRLQRAGFVVQTAYPTVDHEAYKTYRIAERAQDNS